jgi:hypothetical protein
MGHAINEMDAFRNGAAGVVSSAELFRPEQFSQIDHPVCGAIGGFATFVDAAATPPFQGGEKDYSRFHDSLTPS